MHKSRFNASSRRVGAFDPIIARLFVVIVFGAHDATGGVYPIGGGAAGEQNG